MGISISIKKYTASLMFHAGITKRILHNKKYHDVLILMYHRVIHKTEGDFVQNGMYVDPKTFKSHIIFLKNNFNIVPISVLSNFPFKAELHFPYNQSNPFCIITFDDGWKDFYTYVYPILKKYDVNATIFLPTGFIGTKNWFWTDLVGNLFYTKNIKKKTIRKPENSKNTMINILEKIPGTHESKVEAVINLLKPLRQDKIQNILFELSERWEIDPQPKERGFLSWDEVREMYKSGIVSFGSHTESHRILTTLTNDEIRAELIESKNKMIAEEIVAPSFIPFSYPNGNYTNDIKEMVKKAGYNLAVTTDRGWNRFQHGVDLYQLDRIPIHQDMVSSDAMFYCRIAELI